MSRTGFVFIAQGREPDLSSARLICQTGSLADGKALTF